MHMRTGRVVVATAAALLLGALPLVAAHGDEDMDMSMGMSDAAAAPEPAYVPPPSYFRHGQYGGWMMAHIVLMILAWVIVLPVSIMLSIARSRYHLPAQVLFHIVNGLGLLTSFVYNHATPDLYENNAHHPIGWVVTSVTVAWTLMSPYTAYSDYRAKQSAPAQEHPVTSRAMAEYESLQQYSDQAASRYSHDSGHGTERDSASLFGSRQNSSDSIYQKSEAPVSPAGEGEHDDDDEDEEPERRGFLGNNQVDRFISHYVRRFATPRASSAVRFGQIVTEKFLLLLGFLALLSGFVVYGGVFRSVQIFSGMAHFIKGGIFFWYGLLTLGRWMGAFTEFGWAWNIRPDYPLVARWKSRIPSAEFTESFVIWLYGASNVFLEHLNNWGGEWSPQDFEHVSITVLFFGGGLLGMLIESPSMRELMNTTVVLQKSRDEELAEGGRRSAASRFASSSHSHTAAADQPADQQQYRWEQPATYKVPLNPMPGLVIMILGIMMSAHHQNSMVSTMMHAQWGTLFFAFAIARAATYIILYLKPPTSHFPARPPTELVSSFCLTAGGLMFMLSSHDTVWAIESNGLDAMTIFTVTMGLTGLIMGWEVIVFCIKGWAARKEALRAGKPLP